MGQATGTMVYSQNPEANELFLKALDLPDCNAAS